MPTRLHVDAFNHFEWGFIPGRISQIAEDFVTVEQRPVFRVEVALDETHLELRGGARGELRKGMSVQARFVLTRRSLLQLLRDRVVDWIEPGDSHPALLAPSVAG
jgi:membrane fusion protein, peptide pheromone/bacteriocin exporter